MKPMRRAIKIATTDAATIDLAAHIAEIDLGKRAGEISLASTKRQFASFCIYGLTRL
jgi:hypothetical protein